MAKFHSEKFKPKFKARSPLRKDELFSRDEKDLFLHMKYSIEKAFPDFDKRKEYIFALIEGLGKEKVVE